MTQTSRGVQRRLRALSACSQVQLARVGVRVLVLVDVVCVMLVVLIAHVVVHAVNTQFSKPFSVVGDVLFTVRSSMSWSEDGIMKEKGTDES